MEKSAPLFRQIAEFIEDSIVDGTLAAGERAPSINELASFHQINPATARNGLLLLIDAQILEKRRGIGNFVTPQARDLILKRRRDELPANFLAPLIDESVKIGLGRSELHKLIDLVAESRGLYAD